MQAVKNLISILLIILNSSVFAQKATYIANSGVMIQVGSSKVIIDGIFQDNRGKFLSPTYSVLTKIVTGKAPYNDVDLYLITHSDTDHLGKDLGYSLLTTQKSAKLITTSQAVDSMKVAGLTDEDKGNRVITYPFSRSWKFYNGGDIKVKTAFSAHSGRNNKKIQNLIFYMLIGGKRVLHLGDADMDLDRFRALKLYNEKIDIAFVPFWYMTSHYGYELISKYIKADKIVAIHLPDGNSAKYVTKIKQFVPKAIIFQKSGQSTTF